MQLSIKILAILDIHRILNTMEVCRLLNGFGKRAVDVCYKGQGFTFGTREGEEAWGKGSMCNRENCKVTWNKIYRALGKLHRKGLIYTKKMRFYDHTPNRKGKCNDIFRFWYLDKDEFKEQILRQTLIPYVALNGAEA